MPTVMTMFTQTSEETRRLLRYKKEIRRAGSEVVVLKPNLKGTLPAVSTPLIATREPLVPITAPNNLS